MSRKREDGLLHAAVLVRRGVLEQRHLVVYQFEVPTTLRPVLRRFTLAA